MNVPYHGKTILITGASGYLATRVAEMLSQADCRIVRLTRAQTPLTRINGAARMSDVVGDIRERAVWERVLDGVAVIFHFAAQTSVAAAAESPAADVQINVLPMLHLLDVCRQRSLRPIVLFAGTVTEMGLPARLPVDESPVDHPITIYDLHKLMAENYLKHYAGQGTVRGAVLRLANVYGPGPRSRSADRGILNQAVRKALNAETLTVYGHGNYVRDYVYIDDVARAFLEAGAHADQINGQHFVIGYGQGHTIMEAFSLVVERAALRTGRRARVVSADPPTPLSAIETRNFVADTARFSNATGWKAQCSLVEGIDRTIDAILAQEQGRA